MDTWLSRTDFEGVETGVEGAEEEGKSTEEGVEEVEVVVVVVTEAGVVEVEVSGRFSFVEDEEVSGTKDSSSFSPNSNFAANVCASDSELDVSCNYW